MDPIRNIIVPVDYSPMSQAATALAVKLAHLDESSIHLIHAIRFPLKASTTCEISISAAVSEGVREFARDKLEQARGAIVALEEISVTSELSESIDPVQAIAAAVAAKHADLVVMGTHGRTGLRHAVLGSVAERVLRTLDCPVLTVKEDLEIAAAPITRILVAADFSTHSDRAVEMAAALAKRLGASLDIVHAFDVPRDYFPYDSLMDDEIEQKIQASAGESLDSVYQSLKDKELSVEVHCRRGRPHVVITEVAEKIGCQMIVMGTRGVHGLSHVLLGSVAERTVRTARCPVLTVNARSEPNDEISDRVG